MCLTGYVLIGTTWQQWVGLFGLCIVAYVGYVGWKKRSDLRVAGERDASAPKEPAPASTAATASGSG